jgi:hypothetical protein
MKYNQYQPLTDDNAIMSAINFPLTTLFLVLICMCAYFSFKKGAIAGAEITLTALEIDNIISIDDEGTIRPICDDQEID